MRLIPKHVLRHCGQKAAQHAVWNNGKPVTKRQWRAATLGGLKVQHVVNLDGQVVVTCFTAYWTDPTVSTIAN